MKINNKIIIGALSVLLIITGIILDRNLAPVPPNFIYAKYSGYYYKGFFDYCTQKESGCYIKENSYCMQEDIEICTPKICVSENTDMMTQEQYIQYSKMQEEKVIINQKACILARIKAGEEFYIYDSKHRISKKTTDIPEFITSDWEYNNYDINFFGSSINSFRKENLKYVANLPKNIEFISFIK
jgi:hypothetical protein